MKNHPLHKRVGEIFIECLGDKVILDPACGGNQQIPLFIDKTPRNDTKITNVDILVQHNEKIIICEIDESKYNPNHILGKCFSVEIAKYWKLTDDREMKPLDKNIYFLQILRTDKLKKASKKPEQWNNIETILQGYFPRNKKNIKTYKILFGSLKEFSHGNKLENELKRILK